MEIKLSPWQTKVWDDTHRYQVINIGRRGGKTTLAAVKIIDFSFKNKNSIVWYVAPTYKQAKTILWEMMKDLVPLGLVAKKNEQELSITLRTGSKIYLKGADNPDSLRGVRIDFCVFDEVAFYTRWPEVWKIMRPTLADSKADCMFISTPNGFNHFKDLADKVDDDWQYFHYTTRDNPYIDDSEIEAMRAEMDEDSFAQEILGEFRKMKGLIYKDFNRETHMVDIPNFDFSPSWTFTRSLDFGFSHKTAIIWWAINGNGSEIYAYDGVYETGWTTKDIVEAVRIKDAGRMITNPVCDSESPLQIEEMRREGVHFNPIKKGKDSVRQGIQKVAGLLKPRPDTGKPNIMISKHLGWLADEFEKYRWIEVKSGDSSYQKEAPLKRDDDAMDALRYFVMNYQQQTRRPIPPRKKWNIG